jgi:hypothetical protein
VTEQPAAINHVSITEPAQPETHQDLAKLDTPAAVSDTKIETNTSTQNDTSRVNTPTPVAANATAPAPSQTTTASTAGAIDEAKPTTTTLINAATETKKQTLLKEEETTNKDKENGHSGWVYAGQYVDGSWITKALAIDANLPNAGSSYKLNWGSKVRANPPGRGMDLNSSIGFIPPGKMVEVMEVKKSGNKGHIWLKIKR